MFTALPGRRKSGKTLRAFVVLATVQAVACALIPWCVAGGQAGIFLLNDDGGWSWFEDERAVVCGGKIIVGSVAAGVHDPGRCGDIEVVVYDPATGQKSLSRLHGGLSGGRGEEYDDHNSPALFARPDGHIIAAYSKHGLENRFYYRLTARAGDPTDWQPERACVPSETSRITYSNLHWLGLENEGRGRLYNFFRGLNDSFKPSYAWSDDGGESWVAGNVLINVPTSFKHRPYVKYTSNGTDTVHFFYTEGHPRDFDNSAYHVYYRAGSLFRSDGAVVGTLAAGLGEPTEGTRLFRGDPDNVAWVSDIHLDSAGCPYVAYSVQKDAAGLPSGQSGQDHRYRYARWDGRQWRDYEIAYAGRRLYAGEDDYTGNIALDPDDPDTVYISADVDPKTGQPLVSKRDQRRHYEVFKGITGDHGATWRWTPLTSDSGADNIRPIVPAWPGDRSVVLWLRGTYRTYTDYDLDVVGMIVKRDPAPGVPRSRSIMPPAHEANNH